MAILTYHGVQKQLLILNESLEAFEVSPLTWEAILHRARSSNEIFRLTVDECVELYNNAPLHQLMAAAHHRRSLHNLQPK